ncbi:MAG TPA: pyridoxamine 5'-phosphate oxidase family protein [Desulfuromonadaceae bacterium]
MLTDDIKRFIETIPLAFVASADTAGHPHLALGNDIRALDGDHLLFENWFCQTTLRNVGLNPRVAVAVMSRDMATGYQFIGNVAHGFDAAILNGYAPEQEPPGEPQTLTRLVVRVEVILAFCSGIHTDLVLGGSSRIEP